MAAFEQAFLDQVRERTDIVGIVGERVRLRKAGHEFIGLCPFHNEKSPSFTVSPVKQFYHCFGCGAHGNVFQFLTDHSGYSFVEAVESLARNAGLALPAREAPTPEALRQQQRHTHLLGLLARASDLFAKRLRSSTDAIHYLRETRGLTGQTAKQFGIGFAVPDLISAFPGVPSADLEEVGLLVRKDHGELIDKFRQRVMFPIHNEGGRVVGFGGRTLGDGQPKYLNSPDSAVFHKGQELYGLHFAKAAIRRSRTALVLEGYMDVVALHQYGETRAVAALGTSVTIEQLQRLYRHCDRVIFALDGDKPGLAAAARAARLVLQIIADGKSASFVTLPPEHDPDSFVRAHGLDGWNAYLESHATPLSTKLMEVLVDGRDPTLPEVRAALASEANALLATIEHAPNFREALRTHIETAIGLRISRKGFLPARPARQEATGTRDGAPLPDRSRQAFYENFARLCDLSPASAQQVPAILIDDFATLISGWFAVAPADRADRLQAVEGIAIATLHRIVRGAIVATQERADGLGLTRIEAETHAILNAIDREARHAARVQHASALFGTENV